MENEKEPMKRKLTPSERSEFPSEEFLTRALGGARQQEAVWRQLLRRVFYGNENALEGAARAAQSDIRFAARGVLQDSLLLPPCPPRLVSVVQHKFSFQGEDLQ